MLTTSLKDHLALVTGASGGMGKATCLALAEAGCSVAIHYNSAVDTATNLAKEVEKKGVKAKIFKADLRNYDEVRRLHAEVLDQMGRPSILFNNAGVTLKAGVKDLSEITIEDFEATWKANCGQAYLLTQLCVPAMVEKGWGRVIFNSSVAGFTGGRVGPHYASSKSALHGLIHWLSQAYCKQGITVNGVAPALIQETGMVPGDAELAKSRLGYPDEVAETVMWFVKTGYVTNKVICVDGGLVPQ